MRESSTFDSQALESLDPRIRGDDGSFFETPFRLGRNGRLRPPVFIGSGDGRQAQPHEQLDALPITPVVQIELVSKMHLRRWSLATPAIEFDRIE